MILPSIRIIIGCLMVLVSCTDKKKTEKKNPSIYDQKQEKTSSPERTATKTSVPVMLGNKGIGPVTSVTFEKKIDQGLANQGASIFKSKCTACHKARQKLIGPPMEGIYKKRSPEWVMNMILNPEEMIEKDPVAKALLATYNNTVMINQKVTQKEARAMAEWFRTLE